MLNGSYEVAEGLYRRLRALGERRSLPSITHLRRIRLRPSVPWDLLDAAFRFRQAPGRLVRRPGLPPNRRIRVLDGRLAEPEARSRLGVFWAPIERLAESMNNNGG